MNAANRLTLTHSIYVLCYCALSLIGCDMLRDRDGVLTKSPAALPSLQPPADSVQLEVVFLERPQGDRLLGDALWNEVDTILDLEPEEQRDLAKNGFRIGVSGSHPPVALQKLLELRSPTGAAKQNAIQTVQDGRLLGRRIFLRSGESAQVQLNDNPYPEMDFQVYPSHAATTPDAKSYQQARCLYRITVHREQAGWARLEFVPEIQHGQELMRPVAGDSQWEMLSSPLIDRLYPQRFSVILNTGDMALVTCRQDAPGTMGQRLFCGPAGADDIQRMLLVRLAHVGDDEGPFVTAGR